MNNQKKIEDILYSIQELILEARNEEKKDKFEIIEINKINEFKTQNLTNSKNNDQLNLNSHTKTREGKLIKNNSNLKNSWKDLNFEKCQEKHQAISLNKIYEENFENELEQIFKESLNLWVKRKLPDLIKEETAIHTKKKLEEKLK